MDALPEFLYFIGMALRALCRRQLRRSRHFVVIAMAGLAGSVTERAVSAVGNPGSLIGVASRASNLGHFGGVRIVLDSRVAVGASQHTVHASRVLRGINRDALAAARGQSRLAVAGQAVFILLEGLGQRRLCPGMGMCRRAD